MWWNIFIIIFYFFFHGNLLFNIFAILIFFVRDFSDLKFLILLNFVFFTNNYFVSIHFLVDLNLQNTKVIILDQLLKYKVFNYIFVLFCILILINGTNFIDGLNTNVLGYYIIVSFFIFETNKDYFLIEYINWNLWICILIILYLFNLFNKILIGDSGSYLLGFLYGYILIETYLNNQGISPFYIILLIWYPCFETLFSIIRKFRFNKSPILPDTKHIHQLLFLSLKKKYKLSNLKSNIFSAQIINFYNLVMIYLASIYSYNTQYQLILLFIIILIYCYFYFRLFKNLYLKKIKFD